MSKMVCISNNCLGGNLYKHVFKSEYTSPFIWSRITNPEFIFLLDNFKTIDFSSVHSEFYANEGCYKLIVDGKIKILYPHYHVSNDDTIRVEGEDVYYKNINDYTLEKYKSRLEKMQGELAQNTPLLLCYQDAFNAERYGIMNEQTIYKILEHSHEFAKTIILTRYDMFRSFNNDNVYVDILPEHIPPMKYINANKPKLLNFLGLSNTQ